MSHTYSNLIFHVVFSTQGRLPLLTDEIKSQLFAYIGGLIKEKKGKLLVVNGVADHLHILLKLPPNLSISEVMRFIKANSSRWIKERFGVPFAWQKGYGAFSVSQSGVEAVAKYIRDQEIHHAKFNFHTEFLSFLTKNVVEYEEKYLWK